MRIKNSLQQLMAAVAMRYRLSGQTIYSGVDLTFRLLGHLAYSNGYLSSIYLQRIIIEIEKLPQETVRGAIQAYIIGYNFVVRDFEASLRYFVGEKQDKQLLLESCWQMIWADRHLGVREYQLIHLWGYWLGWPRQAIEELGVAYRPVHISTEHKLALALLNVDISTPSEIIKKAYKRQLNQYHPDKIMGAGGSIAEVHKASEQIIKLQEAYSLIRMLHNF